MQFCRRVVGRNLDFTCHELCIPFFFDAKVHIETIGKFYPASYGEPALGRGKIKKHSVL
jgi:hypothetical protein